jgi:ribose transport system substrate-binding protein
MKMRRTGAATTRVVALLVGLGMLAAACGSDPDPAETAGEEPTAEATDDGASEPAPEDTDTEAAAGEEPSMAFAGPQGETPTPASELVLSDEEIAQIQEGNYTAALVWHEDSPFIRAVQKGVTEKFEELGIEIVAATTAEFDAARQADNVSTVLARNPDIIVTIAVDPVSAAEAFRPAVDAGVEIVVLTTPPAGYSGGNEIVGIVTGELTAAGRGAAEMLGEELGGQGKVGWIFHDADFWFTNQRDQAFKDWLNHLYPDMEIVAEAGFSDPARVEEIAQAMLTQNPDLNGVYVAWSTAAAGMLSALRAAGNTDVKIVTNDLDVTLARDMVRGGNVIGIMSNATVDAGRQLGIMAGYGLLDKEAPEMAVAPPVKVTADTIVEGWNTEFGEDPPADVTGG